MAHRGRFYPYAQWRDLTTVQEYPMLCPETWVYGSDDFQVWSSDPLYIRYGLTSQKAILTAVAGQMLWRWVYTTGVTTCTIEMRSTIVSIDGTTDWQFRYSDLLSPGWIQLDFPGAPGLLPVYPPPFQAGDQQGNPQTLTYVGGYPSQGFIPPYTNTLHIRDYQGNLW
jgi:hypothetical protein